MLNMTTKTSISSIFKYLLSLIFEIIFDHFSYLKIIKLLFILL